MHNLQMIEHHKKNDDLLFNASVCMWFVPMDNNIMFTIYLKLKIN